MTGLVLLTSPRCIASWRCVGSLRRRVSLWMTPCAVQNPPPAGAADVLLCPSNQSLTGAASAYFPRGGSPPAETGQSWATSSAWCGMVAGPEMIYPVQCIDGVVDRMGGKHLRKALRALPLQRTAGEVRCEVGSAVALAPPEGSLLRERFRLIVHTPPPTWPYVGEVDASVEHKTQTTLRTEHEERWMAQLRSCYKNGFQMASALQPASGQSLNIVSPLLGAGTAGAPAAAAATVAADAADSWAREVHAHKPEEIHFAVQSESIANIFSLQLVDKLGEPDAGAEFERS